MVYPPLLSIISYRENQVKEIKRFLLSYLQKYNIIKSKLVNPNFYRTKGDSKLYVSQKSIQTKASRIDCIDGGAGI